MKKIFAFLKKLFSRSQALIKKYVRPSVEVVNLLKTFFDSPAVPILTALIPGHIDDVLAAQIKTTLPVVLKVLGFADECTNRLNGETVLQCAVAKLRLMSEDAQKAAAHNIAALLAEYLSDGRLTWTECIHLAEMTYTELKAA